MVSKAIFALVLVGAMVFLCAGLACNEPTEVDEKTCSDNTAPSLEQVFYEINGEFKNSDNLILTRNDELEVYFDYEDDECNLDGGTIYSQIDSGDWETELVFPTNTPCSSDEAAQNMGFSRSFPELSNGVHSIRTLWVDNCNIRSEIKTGEFQIVSGQ